MRIGIIGGGIGGLATAIALARIGVDPTVYERSPRVAPDDAPAGGGALWLWANAVHALETLGLAAAVVEAGTVVRRYEVRTWAGTRLWRVPVAELGERYKAPLIFLGRRQLVDLLTAAFEPRTPAYATSCSGFVESEDGVQPLLVPFPRQDPPIFDGLIGADGFHSVIRSQLLGAETPRSADQVAWTGLAETDAESWPVAPGEMVTFLGNGMFLNAGTVKGEEPGAPRKVYWYATESLSKPRRRGGQIDRGALVRLYRSYHPGVARLMESTPEPTPFHVRDRRPSRRWGRGRVTLLGDAAHPSTPDLGQGACQALEGAVTLARCLERGSDVSSAWRAYEAQRMGRTARITEISRTMTVFTKVNAPGVDPLRNLGIRCWWPAYLMHQYRFILGHVP